MDIFLHGGTETDTANERSDVTTAVEPLRHRKYQYRQRRNTQLLPDVAQPASFSREMNRFCCSDGQHCAHQ